jgi:hypothetical protein
LIKRRLSLTTEQILKNERWQVLKRLLTCLLLAALVFSLAACDGKDKGGGDGYDAFVKAMTDMKEAGDKMANEGLDFQALSMYAFAGASLSSCRYAVEYILWLKGEGDNIAAVIEGSRSADWNEIAAVCYASPYPYYFEGLVFHVQGKNDEAKPCYTAALLNPAYPEDGVDFYYLKDMEVADLYKLRDELRAKETEVYALITVSPARIERDEYSFYPEYLRAKSKEALEAGDNAGAAAYAKAAGSLRGVDYSRITSGISYKTVLELDNMQFQGRLTQGSGVSQAEQDDIIDDVMDDMEITSGMLENAETIIKDAEEKGFKLQDLENAFLKLTGADTLVDLYKLLMGSGGGNEAQNVLTNSGLIATQQAAKDISTNYTLVSKGGKLALKGTTKIGFRLLFLLPDLTEIGLDLLKTYEEHRDAVELALEKKAMLDNFYDECNRRIKEAGGDSGEWRCAYR